MRYRWGGWGLTLEDALTQHPDIDALHPDVITIELPGNAAARRISATGRRLHVIDHHDSTAGARATMYSSLAQFAALVGYTLSKEEYEIAVADRDWLPGLSRAGVSWSRMQALRDAEHEVRDATELQTEARIFVKDNARRLGNINLFHAPARLKDVLLEAAQMPSVENYSEHADKCTPVKLPRVMAVFHADDDPRVVVAVRYAGSTSERATPEPLLADPMLATDLKLWLGGGAHSCFFGAAAHAGSLVIRVLRKNMKCIKKQLVKNYSANRQNAKFATISRWRIVML